jgi:hypothetical protein
VFLTSIKRPLVCECVASRTSALQLTIPFFNDFNLRAGLLLGRFGVSRAPNAAKAGNSGTSRASQPLSPRKPAPMEMELTEFTSVQLSTSSDHLVPAAGGVPLAIDPASPSVPKLPQPTSESQGPDGVLPSAASAGALPAVASDPPDATSASGMPTQAAAESTTSSAGLGAVDEVMSPGSCETGIVPAQPVGEVLPSFVSRHEQAGTSAPCVPVSVLEQSETSSATVVPYGLQKPAAPRGDVGGSLPTVCSSSEAAFLEVSVERTSSVRIVETMLTAAPPYATQSGGSADTNGLNLDVAVATARTDAHSAAGLNGVPLDGSSLASAGVNPNVLSIAGHPHAHLPQLSTPNVVPASSIPGAALESVGLGNSTPQPVYPVLEDRSGLTSHISEQVPLQLNSCFLTDG